MNTDINIDINGNLRKFNQWWDEFILEAIKPVAILSMGLGTVAIFNLQGLAIQPWFVALWAIVQAASIDGLFFATWDRLWQQKLQWKNALAIFGLILIGLTLALVAIVINAILGFQVLWSIADSEQAMAKLGISPALFTAIRAALAVIVFVMISYVRSRARINEEANRSTRKSPEPKKFMVPEPSTKVIPADKPDVLALPEPSKRDAVKRTIEKFMAEGKKFTYQQIADASGASLQTVKKHAPTIKKELGGV